MAQPQDHISMALFCDFENVALGVRDANYEKFDIKRVLERLLLKGSIVVKKAYCDWDRYRQFKGTMHEANFELIEIPHVRQSGKNSADIRMVVDALDLCYTKSHVNTFVIISGDSDFSPLVSKLRENAKYVIGVGVKQSTSDLLIANCDEFIFYDDLVRDLQRQRRDNRDQPQQRRSPEEEKRRREEMDARRTKVVEMAAETYEALVTDRDEGGRVWASVLKEALKRRNPGFSEQYYGFRTFGNLLEEAQARGLLELGRDEKSGLFVSRGNSVPMRGDAAPAPSQAEVQVRQEEAVVAAGLEAASMALYVAEPGGDGTYAGDGSASFLPEEAHAEAAVAQDAGTERQRGGRGRQRGGRKTSARKTQAEAAPASSAGPAEPVARAAELPQAPRAAPTPPARTAMEAERPPAAANPAEATAADTAPTAKTGKPRSRPAGKKAAAGKRAAPRKAKSGEAKAAKPKTAEGEA